MAKRETLPPFPHESMRVLEQLADSAKRLHRSARPLATAPSAGSIIIDRGAAEKRNRFCIARLDMTYEDVPVYQHEAFADTLDDAVEVINPIVGDIELED